MRIILAHWAYYNRRCLENNGKTSQKKKRVVYVHFCPQPWLLCHLGLYKFEFEFVSIIKRVLLIPNDTGTSDAGGSLHARGLVGPGESTIESFLASVGTPRVVRKWEKVPHIFDTVLHLCRKHCACRLGLIKISITYICNFLWQKKKKKKNLY